MSPKIYRDILERRLCLKCRKPTHRSSAVQRQCPECRRKRSFVRAEKRWRLIECFCEGLNARRAAVKAGTAYGTALNLFRELEAQARKSRKYAFMKVVLLRQYREPIPEKLKNQMLLYFMQTELDLPLWRKFEKVFSTL